MQNSFSRLLSRDTPPYLQPEGTVTDALNVLNQTNDHLNSSYSAEPATTLDVDLPEGFILRGSGFIEERDQFVVFLYHKEENESQIGIIDLKKKTYTKRLSDRDLDCNLCFGVEEWIRPEIKSIEPCHELKIYWSHNRTYYHLNLDRCEEESCDDLRLFKCVCAPRVTPRVDSDGGSGLSAGAYQFAVQLEDEDGNTTNYSDLSEVAYVGSDHNEGGEKSDESINVSVEGLNDEYSKVNIAVVKRIKGTTVAEHLTTVGYQNSDSIDYEYTGPTGDESTIDINKILTKKRRYVRGKNLFQYDGRLILYQISGEENLDYQRVANQIKSKYITYRVPYDQAHKYKSLMRGELYAFGIVFQYCDGTHSPVFHIPGRSATARDKEMIDVCEDLPEPSLPRDPDISEEEVVEDEDIVRFEISISAERIKEVVACFHIQCDQIPVRWQLNYVVDGEYQTLEGVNTAGYIRTEQFIFEEEYDYSFSQEIAFDQLDDEEEEFYKEFYNFCCEIKAEVDVTTFNANVEQEKEIVRPNSESGIDPERLENCIEGNCTECEIPRWKAQNTSRQYERYCTDVYEDSMKSVKEIDYSPGGQRVTQPEDQKIQETGELEDRASSTANKSIAERARETRLDQCDCMRPQCVRCSDVFKNNQEASCGDNSGCGGAANCKGGQEETEDGVYFYLELKMNGANPSECSDPREFGLDIIIDGTVIDRNSGNIVPGERLEFGPYDYDETYDASFGWVNEITDPSDPCYNVSAKVTADSSPLSSRGTKTSGDIGCGSLGCGGGSCAGGGLKGGCSGTQGCSGSYGYNGGCGSSGCATGGCGGVGARGLGRCQKDGCIAQSKPNTANLGEPLQFRGSELDYDMTAVNGGTHNIKKYCDSGKTVVVDIFATWCGPCWNYHQSKALEKLHNSSDVVVLAIEGDLNTDDDALYDNSRGNYVEGTSYPVINLKKDNKGLLEDLDIVGYPSVFIIEPDDTGACSTTYLGQPSYSELTKLTGDETKGQPTQKQGEQLADPLGRLTQQRPQGNVRRKQKGKYEDSDCPVEYIWDEEGCRIIGVKPVKYSEGKMGYWESTQNYPLTKDCDGNYIYGNLAGGPIRHHRMPDTSQEPHFVSYQNGVVSQIQPDNVETENTYVHILGVGFENIKMPESTPKPLCDHTPYKIVMVPRDETNKSVLAKGLITGMFRGESNGSTFAFPKLGVNSLEFFDRHIKRSGDESEHRGGEKLEIGAYNFHSPDTQFKQGKVDADRLKVDLELNGQGYKYGSYADGKDPEDKYDRRLNQKGTRVAINLNHYREPTIIPGDDKDITVPQDDVECDCLSGAIRFWMKPYLPGRPLTFNYRIEVDGAPYFLDGTVNVQGGYSGDEYSQSHNIHGDISGSFTLPEVYSGQAILKVTIDGEDAQGCVYEEFMTVSLDFQGGFEQEEQPFESRYFSDVCGTPPEPDGDTEPEAGTDITTKHLRRCLKAVKHAEADSKVTKGDDFKYSMLNFYRESSVYMELDHDGPQLFLGDSIDRFLGDRLYNGNPYGNLGANHTCDGSFFGDTLTHHQPIHHASAWYGTLEQYNPDQYGRVETLQYVDLGLEADGINCGCVEGPVGDTFIAMHSFKRTAYVSDKVGSNEGRPITVDFLYENDLVQLLDQYGFFSNIADFSGVRDCNIPPKHRDVDDVRNTEAGLRLNLEDGWTGKSGFNGFSNNGGIYYPALLTTLVHFPVETEVNLHYRKTGSEEIGEVYYSDLEGLTYDSDVNEGADWEDCWMNEFYAEMPEMSARTRMSKLFMYLGVRLGIPFASFSSLAGVTSIANAAPILAMGGALTFMLNRFLDDHIDSFLSGTECKSDEEGGPGDGIVKGYRDNYYGYNWDYSHHSVERFAGVPDPYDTCPCLGETTLEILYSEKQTLGSPIDAYRNYKVNNYIELSAHTGPIQKIFTVGAEIYVHTTDNIWKLFGKSRQLQAQDSSLVYLGQGDLFQNAHELYGSIVEGHGGIKDPNAAISTSMGYVFIDREARQMHHFNGSQVGGQEMFSGMYAYFKENNYFELLDDFPDFPLVDEKSPYGIGYNLGIDHRYNRILFTKKDYRAKDPDRLELDGYRFVDKESGDYVNLSNEEYFEDRSFTLSYSLVAQKWASFHSYRPDVYLWDRSYMYSIAKNGLWRHYSNDTYQTYYGEYEPASLEFVTRGKENPTSFKHNNTSVDMEVISYKDGDKIHKPNVFFTDVLLSNRTQCTGWLPFKRDKKGTPNAINRIKEGRHVKVKNADGLWRYQSSVDRVKNIDEPMFKDDNNRIVDEDNIGNEKNPLYDRYLRQRLSFDRPEHPHYQWTIYYSYSDGDFNIK